MCFYLTGRISCFRFSAAGKLWMSTQNHCAAFKMEAKSVLSKQDKRLTSHWSIKVDSGKLRLLCSALQFRISVGCSIHPDPNGMEWIILHLCFLTLCFCHKETSVGSSSHLSRRKLQCVQYPDSRSSSVLRDSIPAGGRSRFGSCGNRPLVTMDLH